MRLSDDIYEFIKGEVIALFEKYEIKCIPISGFELAMKMGMTLIQYSSLSPEKKEASFKISSDGYFLEKNNGQECIFFNDAIGYHRANMTILHEIGHCVMDHVSGTDEEEAEARFFAKYAAAPPPLIHRIKPQTPEDIAEAFDISYEASVYALEYYHKWLNSGQHEYTDYEERLLDIFDSGDSGESGKSF